MNKIAIVTSKKNRFNRSVNIKGHVIAVDATGTAVVDENVVVHALAADFELVDKNAQFSSKEEQEHVDEVNAILDSAKIQAAEIVEAAKKEAAEIVEAAKKEAAEIRNTAAVDEKVAKREELGRLKLDELKSILAEAGFENKDYADKKKADLIDMVMSFIFDENVKASEE